MKRVFLVLAPPYNDVQVQILGHIVRTMQEPVVRELLLQASDADDIWSIFSRTFASKRVVRTVKSRRQSYGPSSEEICEDNPRRFQ